MNITRFSPLAFFLVFLSQFLLMGCDQSFEHSVAKHGLVFCSEGNPDTLNPQFATSGIAFDAGAHTLFNQLVEFQQGSTQIIPGLAKSWEISPDGLTYRFKLREDVKFHQTKYFSPSRHMNANDVLFSFNRQRLKEHPYHFVSQRSYPYFESMGLRNLITDIKKIDNYTVEFHLSRPESPFLSFLAMEFASILSAEYAQILIEKDKTEQFDLLPVGTGPFQFIRHVPDSHIRFKAHPSYFKGMEKIRYLVFAITPEPSLRYARLTAGECDVMANPLPAYLNLIEKKPDLKVYQKAGLNVGYWAFNTKKPPLDNPKVRQALSHAVNRHAILRAVYYDSGEIAESPLPPSLWGHNSDLQSYHYNPILAKKMLFDAGVTDLSIDIWALPVQRPYNPDALKMAELIKHDLERVGVTASVVTYEWSTFINKVNQGEHDTALLGWISDSGDPDNFLSPLLSCKGAITGSNRAFWCNREFDSLISKGKVVTEQHQRAQLYKRAQSIFKRHAPWLTIAHSVEYVAAHKSVKNLKQSPSGGLYFSGVYLDR